MKFAEAIGAPLFNGNGSANTSLIQSDPFYIYSCPKKKLLAWKMCFKNVRGIFLWCVLQTFEVVRGPHGPRISILGLSEEFLFWTGVFDYFSLCLFVSTQCHVDKGVVITYG